MVMLDQKTLDESLVFVLKDDKNPKEANLMHLEWAVVAQLDGKKSVRQIANNLSLNAGEVEDIFKKLIGEDLVLQVENTGQNNRVPQEVFKLLSHEMTLLLGPVAGIIVDDVLNTMHISRDHFEKRHLPILIDVLTNQIDDPVKQIEFQRKIYPKIKRHLLQI